MTVLERISFYQGRRDEVPNQELARHLAETADHDGIREIAAGLSHRNSSVRSDCLKVLYEISYIDPALIEEYTPEFLGLLRSKNNRMVWGAMIALAAVSARKAAEVWQRIDDVLRAVHSGTVITVVWGVRVLAAVASANAEYRERLFPVLLEQLRTCIPRDVPTHAESALPAIDDGNRQQFAALLHSRESEMSASQLARLRKVLRRVEPTART